MSSTSLLSNQFPSSGSSSSWWTRRRRALAACIGCGLGTPAWCWLLVLCGIKNDEYHLDKIATFGVCFAVYSPITAFINNPDEQNKRPLREKLALFGFYWFAANAGFQFIWELPWFILKKRLWKGVNQDDIWLWPWFAYGMCDHRYLTHNDLSLAISAMDASIAIGEVLSVYLAIKQYDFLSYWISIVLVSCQSWGQFYFYVGEIYNNFSNMQDTVFGNWMKYGVMNIPWVIFPFLGNAGFIWSLAVMYKQKGVEEYLQANQGTVGKRAAQSFSADTSMFMQVFESCEGDSEDRSNYKKQFDFHEPAQSSRSLAVYISWFILVFPWIFLLADSLIFYSLTYW